MCGLFGTILQNNNESDVIAARQARDILIHRGPDQAEETIYENIYMGHRRLSILDLSDAGKQPMINDTTSVSITVNGEIYNFQSLREELRAAGYTFKSESDSEVVLHGYAHWGLIALAERLDGMYVIVIHDRADHTIHMIRDRAGIKPLFYYHKEHKFSWASELKALMHWLPTNEKEFDNTALYDFLTYRYIPAPKSLYKNIYKLLPAQILSFNIKTGRIETKPYWELPISSRNDDDETLAREFQALVSASVSAQLISDVPIGFLLSGGIDSSIITMVGAALSSQPQTYSIGFQGARDESRFAKQVSEAANTTHHLHMFDESEMDNLGARMNEWFDEPFGDTSAFPTQRVCAFARKNLIVALSGDGGDELFGGYVWYELFNKLGKIQRFIPFGTAKGFRFPKFIPKHHILTLLSMRDPLEQYAYIRGSVHPNDLKKWQKRLGVDKNYDRLWAYRKYYKKDQPRRKAAQIIDFHTYLPDDILTKVDRTSMSVSLECRPPFLSRSLIEFAFSLPERFLYKDGKLKGGMKYAFKDLIADNILNRKKQGFSVPYKSWKKDAAANGETLQESLLGSFINVTETK